MAAQPRRGGAPLTRIMIVSLLVAAALSLLAVKNVGDRAARNEATVLKALSEVRLQDALEWRAISGEGSDDLEPQHDASVLRALELLENATLDDASTVLLIAMQRAYSDAVEREFQLLGAGREEQAEEWDEAQVDPAAESLLDNLEAVAADMRSASLRASRWTGAGLLGTLLASLGLMALLQRSTHTDRARQQQQLLSEARYRAIIDQSRDLVLVCDPRGRLEYVSPAAQRILSGTALSQPSSLIDALPPEDVDRFGEFLAETQRDGEGGPIDLRLDGRGVDENGVVHQFTARDLSAIASVGGLVLTGQDVTRARTLDQAKTDFVSTVSHELRTPLTSICGYVELVRAGEFGTVPPGMDAPLSTVDRNAHRLIDLVEELLFLSGLDARLMPVEPKDLDLVEVVEAVVAEARVVYPDRRIDLDLTAAPPRVPLLGVRDDLERVAGNILANAIKFSPRGGTVTVALSVRQHDAEISVTDHGIGIPLADQERLFERFFRATDAQQHAIPGTGLGLAVCKTIVDAHAGTISIKSRPGEGTTVLVRIPSAVDGPLPATTSDLENPLSPAR